MPRKKPMIGPEILDHTDNLQRNRVESVARGQKPQPTQAQTDAQLTTQAPPQKEVEPKEQGSKRNKTPKPLGQIRATVNPNSQLGKALDEWTATIDASLKHLVKPSNVVSLFLKDHDDELAKMFRKDKRNHSSELDF